MAEQVPQVKPFEIFIMLCTKIGLGTPYLILSQTGVGVGASSPILKRLTTKGLLTPEPGPRRQVFYRLTGEGELQLENAMKQDSIDWKTAAHGTYEGLPRVIFFSWLLGNLDNARVALHLTEASLSKRVSKAEVDVEHCRSILRHVLSAQPEYASPEYVAAAYKLIGSVAFIAEAKLKVKALEALRRLTDELPPTLPVFLRESPIPATEMAEESRRTAKQQSNRKRRA
ncbi:MAG: hypothetical protein ACLGSD_08605 [Acidobacteriota bacterium]